MSDGSIGNPSQLSGPSSPSSDGVSVSEHPKGVALTCINLTYSVKTNSKQKLLTILHDVSLYLLPGELTAFLGPSGCGKTSVLDCLSGRKTSGIIDPNTKIHYNGSSVSQDYLRKNVGYTEQQDTLLSMLTPFEMLLYTSELKHSRHEPLSRKKSQVLGLLTQLGLNDCKNTVVGSPTRRGISGGEAKRVNIGIALITSPKVLFIDELTSGLDSFTAHNTVEVVNNLKHSGMTICVSIHSPPPYTFQLFDRVVVLQKGRVVYQGSANGDAVFDYFKERFPTLRKRRPNEGVADFLLDVTTRVNTDPEKAAVFADEYSKSTLYTENVQKIKKIEEKSFSGSTGGGPSFQDRDLEAAVTRIAPPETPPSSTHVNNSSDATSPPSWYALLILFKYRSLKSYCQSTFIAPRTGDKFMIVFLVVTIWWNRGDNPQAATGILFLWSMLSAFTSMGILPTIVLERPVYQRERAGAYIPPYNAFYNSFNVEF
jgi:ABC-type multidrug transport system ATPase subunit